MEEDQKFLPGRTRTGVLYKTDDFLAIDTRVRTTYPLSVLMTEKEQIKAPKSGAGDAAHAVVRAALSAIPTAGGPAAELFTALVTPPLEKRRREWMEDVGEALQRLERDRGINLEELKTNDGFIDVVMQASQVALRNSQQEKREALRNAVLNSALPSPPEHSLQQMFIGSVDSLTIWHLRLLKLFNEPRRWFNKNNRTWPDNLSIGGLSHVVEQAFPELRGQRDLYDQIWRDLYSRGFVNTEGLHVTMTGSGLAAQRTTTLGSSFIKFIEEPA